MNKPLPRLLLSLLIGSTLMLAVFRGGAEPSVEAFCGLIFGLVLLAAPRPRRLQDPLLMITASLWLLWLLWLGLQLIPLPVSWVELLSPASLHHWNILQGWGVASQVRLSLAPAEGWLALSNSIGLFCLWLGCALLIRRQPALLRPAMLTIAAAGSVQALLATLAHLSGWSIPGFSPDGFVHTAVAHGSFANRNHFAAYLVLTAAVCLALLVGSGAGPAGQWQSILRRWLDLLRGPTVLLRVMLLMMIVGVVLSRSRMGNTSLAVGLTIFALVWLLRTQSLRNFARTAALFLSIAIVDVALISDRYGLNRVIERITTTDIETESRTIAWQRAIHIGDDFPITGAGFGSYARLEHTLRTEPAAKNIVYAHNDHLQLLAEVGRVGYALLAALVVAHALLARRVLRSRRALHAAMGAAVLMMLGAALVHATTDFHFYMPGWRSLFVACLGLLAGIPPPRKTRDRPSSRTHLMPRAAGPQ